MARDDTAHSGPAANGTGAKGALNGGGSKVPPTVADEHVPQFRLPVDSEHKAKALNLLSVAAPHMRAFHLSWVRPRALCHLSPASCHLARAACTSAPFSLSFYPDACPAAAMPN